jgi:hypothetical protein
MSSDEPLGILIDEIEALASITHERCRSRCRALMIKTDPLQGTHASSDFDTVKWDIVCLRRTVKDITIDLSEPKSNIRLAEPAKREALAAIIRSYRPLLEQLDQLAAKDQTLKKKRIWRGPKDNTVALDRYHRELQFQTQTLTLYLSLIYTFESPEKSFHEDFERGGREISSTAPAAGQGAEVDVQWSLLRRRLVEDGITDIDIEAHTSSIRALLQERLPSYYDIHSGPSVEQHDGSGQVSTGSREILPRTTSQPDHRASNTSSSIAQIGIGHGAQPGGPAILSSFSTSCMRDASTHAPLQAKDDKPQSTEKYPLAVPAHVAGRSKCKPQLL